MKNLQLPLFLIVKEKILPPLILGKKEGYMLLQVLYYIVLEVLPSEVRQQQQK